MPLTPVAIQESSGKTSRNKWEKKIPAMEPISSSDVQSYSLENLPPGFQRDFVWTLPDPTNPDVTKMRYIVSEKPSWLNRHGEGYTIKVWDAALNRMEALKIKVEDNVLNTRDEEARLLALIEHPNIPKVYNMFSVRDPSNKERPCMTTQWIEGPSLGSIIHHYDLTGQSIAPIAIQKIANEAGNALNHIHSLGLVHRDIKPNHILIRNSDQNTFLIDVGTSCKRPSFLEHTDLLYGTDGYRDQESLLYQLPTKESDIFAFAVTMYELLTAYHPFSQKQDRRYSSKYYSENLDTLVLKGKTNKLVNDKSLVYALGYDACRRLDYVFSKAFVKKRIWRYHRVDKFVAQFNSALDMAREPKSLIQTMPNT